MSIKDGFYTPREVIEALQALPEALMDYPSVHGWDTGEIYVWIETVGDIEVGALKDHPQSSTSKKGE